MRMHALRRMPRAILLATGVLSGYARLGRGQVPRHLRPISGVGYSIRVTSAPASGSGIAGAVADPGKSYSATAVFAAGRGRLDITEGGIDPLFAKGDYVLFDSTALLIVHPATREFVPVPPDAGPNLDQLAALGVKVTISDLKVSIDSEPRIDTVAGYPTRHFRLTIAYNMAVEGSGVRQRLASEVTTDYWVASVAGLPGNPFLRANGFSGTAAPSAVFKELSSRVDSAAAVMGARVALRTITASRLIQGPGSVVALRQTSEVAEVRARDVDESYLILPGGYTLGAIPGTEPPAPGSGDPGAKWRVLPRAGSR
jgi:hypothetical protein